MSTEKIPLITLLRNREFAMVFSAGLISDIGSNFSYIAFLFLAISFTSHLSEAASAQAVALIMVAQIIPSLIIGPFAGVIVDRFDRKKIMIVADLIGAATMLSTLLATAMYQLYIISFFAATTRLFFYPARGASIPKIVAANQLVQANGITQTMTQLSGLIGPAIAGIVVYAYGFDIAFIVDGISFLISALMILTVTTDLRPQTDGRKFTTRKMLRDMHEGLLLIINDKAISYIMVLFLFLLLGIGMVNPLLAFYLENSFNLTEQDFGFIVSFSAMVGFIAAISLTLKGQITHKITMVTASTFIIAIALTLMGYAPYSFAPVLMLYIAMAFVGVINISINVPLSALFQAIIEDHNLGKINAFMGTVLAFAQVGAAALATLLVSILPISTILIAGGIFTGVIGAFGTVFIAFTHLENDTQRREQEQIEKKLAARAQAAALTQTKTMDTIPSDIPA